MQYLLGVDSVHTAAAICDYLGERTTAGDAVAAVAVAPPGDATARRDTEEALNVLGVRLTGVDTELRTGEPAAELLAAAAAVDADELVVGSRSGEPGAETGLGSTVRRLLERADRPVVVVPVPEF